MPAVWRMGCGWEIRQVGMVAGTGAVAVGTESSEVVGKFGSVLVVDDCVGCGISHRYEPRRGVALGGKDEGFG